MAGSPLTASLIQPTRPASFTPPRPIDHASLVWTHKRWEQCQQSSRGRSNIPNELSRPCPTTLAGGPHSPSKLPQCAVSSVRFVGSAARSVVDALRTRRDSGQQQRQRERKATSDERHDGLTDSGRTISLLATLNTLRLHTNHRTSHHITRHVRTFTQPRQHHTTLHTMRFTLICNTSLQLLAFTS